MVQCLYVSNLITTLMDDVQIKPILNKLSTLNIHFLCRDHDYMALNKNIVF